MDLSLLLAAAVFGGLGVAFGAFGAHALRRRLEPEMLAVFETGVRYQMYHAAALLGVAVLVVRMSASILPSLAGCLMVIGVLVFSGSLYLLALTGRRAIGAITPLGGLILLAGWVVLAAAAAQGLTVVPAVP